MIHLSAEMPSTLLVTYGGQHDEEFALAHRVLEDRSYAAYYRDCARTGKRVILDNSFHELGHPIPIADLLEAATRVDAHYVVVPDQLDEFGKNIGWLLEATPVFALTKHRMAAVLSGDTPVQRSAFIQLVRDRGIDMIMLPFKRPRLHWFMQHSHELLQFRNIHLLGVNELSELVVFAAMSNLFAQVHFSVDTAKHIKWGLLGQEILGLTTLRGCTITNDALVRMNAEAVSIPQDATIQRNIIALKEICR